MAKQKIFMIGNAHLDPAWVWSWQEGSCEAKATIRSALDRMKEYPDFKFVCSSSSIYQWIEDFDPDMFKEMQERVKEGKFIIVGGWKVQPDCNLPNGENFARQSLYAQRYFFEKFGTTSKIGYNVDSFGHNAMMPQILKKSGMDHYVYMRPMEWEKSMKDNVFTWEAPDDSQVTAFRICDTYCKNFESMEDLENHLEACNTFYKGQDFMCFYGVGNHGGGPTIKNIELIKEYNAKPNAKYELIMADPLEFFQTFNNENTLPVLTEELQHHASGCYSAVSEIKALMRKGECRLTEAENFSVLASTLINKPYPMGNIQNGWENLNFLAFHDIMGGCCVKSAYDNCLYMGYESISLAEKQKNNALQSLSWKIDTSDKQYGYPIIIFNSHPFEIEEVVEINNHVLEIYDKDGNAVPFVNAVSEAMPVFQRDNAIFTAKVPALGYSVYYYKASANFNKIMRSEGGYDSRDKKSNALTLENSKIKCLFNNNGAISSIIDKKIKQELLRGNTNAVIINESEHDTWSHSKNYFNKKIGEFKFVSAEKLESNDIRETVKVVSTYNNSTLIQYYTLNQHDDFISVQVKLNWNEKHKMLKLTFPVDVNNPTSLYEIPFGVLERPCNGEEEPALTWAMVGNSEKGLAILTDSKYSYSATENELALTAIRSPIYCDHGLLRMEDSNYTDQGIHEFKYAILPANTKNISQIFKFAAAFNTPATAIMENHHDGVLPLTYSAIDVNSHNIIVSAFKKSEDGTGYVIRAYECEGIPTETILNCKALGTISTTFAPFEIKTFLIKDGRYEEVLFTEFKN